jgi:PAS domain S-box-containing protein
VDTAAPHAPAAEEALDQLLRQIITGFFVLTDGQGALSKWSDPAELLFDLPAEEALGEPFFGRLVDRSDLSAEADQWRHFVETGEVPGSRGRVHLDANQPGGGRFRMETVFVPVKLDEGFDFSLFLEDLSFELPVEMMLLRMRQQHPVVITALRQALADQQQPWEGWRTAGTLIAFRPLGPTPWMEAAMARREAEAAAAEEELQSRIQMYESPEVQGTDVYDLEDARAVIDRLKWATERIEDLEERSRIMEGAAAQAADAQIRAEAAERAALDAKAELGAIAERPVAATGEAERLELLARVERVERAAEEAAATAADARRNAELERTRAVEADKQRAELAARIEAAERQAHAAVDAARTELAGRMAALETDRGAQAAVEEARAALIQRVEAAEHARAEELQALRDELTARVEGADVRDELDRIKAAADEAAAVRAEVEALRAGMADAAALRDDAATVRETLAAMEARLEEAAGRDDAAPLRTEIADLRVRLEATGRFEAELDAVRERTETAEALLRRSEEREAAAARDADAARGELRATLQRVEQLSEETARLRAHVDAGPADAPLSGEDRRRIEDAHREAEEARAAIESLRAQAEELRAANAEAREEAGRLQARLNELADGDGQARHDLEALRREQDEIKGWLEDARRERDEARQQVREAVRGAEEARAALEREAREAPARAAEALSESKTTAFLDGAHAQFVALHEQAEAARARIDELTAEAEDAVRRAEEARTDAAAARGETAEVREEARDAQRTAREAVERVDLVDRGAANVLGEIKASKAIIEEIGALARSAQHDASESRADAGEARAVVARLEQLLAAAREQAEQAAGEAAGAREQAAAAEVAADAARELAGGVGDIAHAVASEVVSDVTVELETLRADVQALRDAPAPEFPELPELPDIEAPLTEIRGEIAAQRDEIAAQRDEMGALRTAIESAEAGDAGAVEILSARLDALEAAPAVPEGIDARMDSLRDAVSGAMGRLESLATEFAASRTESGVTRTNVEQRLADAAADLMAARTDAEQARRGIDGLRDELTALREYAAAARAEAAAAKEAAASARQGAGVDDRTIEELRAEVKAAVATLGDMRKGFDEARQAAVAARRDADAARAACEKVGAVNEATSEKFTEVWKQMLNAGPRPGSGDRSATGTAPQQRIAPKKEAPPERPARTGFDDDPRPMAVLDLKGKFKELNPAFSKLVGYREHEFGKATWPSVLDRSTYKEQTEELTALVAGEQQFAEVNSTYMHGQGLMVLVKGEIRVQRGEDGEPESLLLVADAGGPGGS